MKRGTYYPALQPRAAAVWVGAVAAAACLLVVLATAGARSAVAQ